ncbi:hypothetical protein, partial [Pseudomonas sp. FW305-47B]|uniref:hypothetical protein n=1 Tax=Pseudomonas sp. FW305-47B TaxID=2070558 RepID=UPI001C4932D0
LVRMRQIEIAGGCRGDRSRINLMIDKSLQAVDLKPKGRRGHVSLPEGHSRHRPDKDTNFRVFVEAPE